MTRLALLALVTALSSTACAAQTVDETSSSAETSAPRMSVVWPLSSPNLEALRSELSSSELGFSWVADESDTFAVRVEPWDPSARPADTVQRAFTFRARGSRPLIHGLTELPRPETTAALARALDAVGRSVDSPDAATTAERTKLDALLQAATREDGVLVFTGTLHEPDMSWEGVLVVVDPHRGELLFATGGYGS
jgi:hypothetical protein